MRADTPTDWQGSRVWRAVGVNPLLRFIQYRQGGLLIPHYDAPYEAPDGRRTLMSVLLYLADARLEADRGATRLLIDPQRNRPLSERDYADWPSPEPSNSPRVLFRVQPRAGSALVLDHRILHDADSHEGDSPKLLLRTDILFEPCEIRARQSVSVSVPAPRLPLWEKLALDPGASRAQVDAAYRRLSPAERAQSESRLAWKVLRDPFYASAYPHSSPRRSSSAPASSTIAPASRSTTPAVSTRAGWSRPSTRSSRDSAAPPRRTTPPRIAASSCW